MQGYLFPTKNKYYPDPYKVFFEEILPKTQRNILIIDPSPDDLLIHTLADKLISGVNCQLLIRRDILNLGDSIPPDALKPETRRLIQDNHIQVRALNKLSARLIIADDVVLLISGNPCGDLCWSMELNPIDSQPVIDFWLEKYHEATRLSDSQALELWDSYQERFWSGQVRARDIVALYNQRGAFVDIQVRIFSGFRQETLYPFASSSREGPRGPVIRWRLIKSEHYQNIGKSAARIHGLKSLSFVRETAAGAYIKSSDFSSWNELFTERNDEFRDFIRSYLDEHYEEMFNEGREELLNLFLETFHNLRENQQLLPILNEEYIKEQALEIHLKNFPTRESLQFACQSRYILYGLHPSASSDKVLMDSLAASAVSDILI